MIFFWKNFLEALAVVLQSFNAIVERIGDLFHELILAAPNPLKMLNALTEFATGLAGIAIGKTSTTYFGLLASLLEKSSYGQTEGLGRPYQHVMTPAKSVRWISFQLESIVTFLTNTSEQSLVPFLLQRFGIWLWHLFKKFKLLLKIIGIRSEADFVAIVSGKIGTFVGRAWALAAIVVFGFLLVTCISTTGMLLFFSVAYVKPDGWEKFSLFGQHKRRKEKVRIYRRVGGVSP
jgi:hypothetical protein